MPEVTAIVLAAGVNRRLGETPVPKSMLSLTGDDSGPTFLDRHAALLAACGASEVAVVLSADVHAHHPSPAGMRGVVNPFDTSATGSTLSLLCALRALGPAEDRGLLVMDADTLYERALLEWVFAHSDRSRLFVTPDSSGDDEEVRVYGQGPEAPVLLGKGLRPAMVEGLELLGESLGMIYVAPDDVPRLHETCEWLAGWGGEPRAYGFAKERSEHEEVWQYLFNTGRMAVGQLPSGLAFTECDTPEDYARVRAEYYPLIVSKDSL